MKELRNRLVYLIIPGFIFLGGMFLAGYDDTNEADRLKHMGEHLTTVSMSPPDDLNFAGEIVPMHQTDVKERLDRELIRNIFYHSATIMNLKRANRWKDRMTTILKENGIPEDFFYLCIAESHLTNATSPAGAKGFWQFMPATARMYGMEVTKQVDERYDPIKSTYAACRYLKDAYRVFKNWTLVAASYNMGVGGVKNAMAKQQVDSYYDLYLNRETAAYVFRILAIKSIMQNPEKYGFNLDEIGLYSPYGYKQVTLKDTTVDLIDFAISQGTNYKSLKLLNPWMLKDKLVAANGVEYTINIPKDAITSSDLQVTGSDSVVVQDSIVESKPAKKDSLKPKPAITPPADSSETSKQ